MGMFKDLMNHVFHAAGDAGTLAPSGTTTVNPIRPGSAAARGETPPGAAPATPAPSAAAPMTEVDVESGLDKLAATHKEKLDWKRSIVDLMKLVGMDSSLSARKELAADLHYTGDTNDSAAMNIWLHKEVMKKLSENGGKVPASLLGH
jgi:hypothetical protein